MKHFKRKATDFLFGAAIVPFALGITHGNTYALEQEYLTDDYSLKNRLKCAYSINTPESHKYYTTKVSPELSYKNYYSATPKTVYPATVLLGGLCVSIGSVAAIVSKKIKQRR